MKATIGPLLQEVWSSTDSLELDPARLQEEKGGVEPTVEELERNMSKILAIAKRFLDALIQSEPMIPYEIRYMCSILKSTVEDRFSKLILQQMQNQVLSSSNTPAEEGDNVMKSLPGVTAVGGFFFLRFVVPLIASPTLFQGFVVGDGNGYAKRKLTLVSKIIQNIANGVEFGKKERYMAPANDFVLNNLERVQGFLIEVATLKPRPKQALPSSQKFPGGQYDQGLKASMAKTILPLYHIHQYLKLNLGKMQRIINSEYETLPFSVPLDRERDNMEIVSAKQNQTISNHIKLNHTEPH